MYILGHYATIGVGATVFVAEALVSKTNLTFLDILKPIMPGKSKEMNVSSFISSNSPLYCNSIQL